MSGERHAYKGLWWEGVAPGWGCQAFPFQDLINSLWSNFTNGSWKWKSDHKWDNKLPHKPCFSLYLLGSRESQWKVSRLGKCVRPALQRDGSNGSMGWCRDVTRAQIDACTSHNEWVEDGAEMEKALFLCHGGWLGEKAGWAILQRANMRSMAGA